MQGEDIKQQLKARIMDAVGVWYRGYVSLSNRDAITDTEFNASMEKLYEAYGDYLDAALTVSNDSHPVEPTRECGGCNSCGNMWWLDEHPMKPCPHCGAEEPLRYPPLDTEHGFKACSTDCGGGRPGPVLCKWDKECDACRELRKLLPEERLSVSRTHRVCDTCGGQAWGTAGERCPGPNCDGSCSGTIVLGTPEEVAHIARSIEDGLLPCKMGGYAPGCGPTPEAFAEMRANGSYLPCDASAHLPGCPEGRFLSCAHGVDLTAACTQCPDGQRTLHERAVVDMSPPELHTLMGYIEHDADGEIALCSCNWMSEPHDDDAADAHLEHAVNALREQISQEGTP